MIFTKYDNNWYVGHVLGVEMNNDIFRNPIENLDLWHIFRVLSSKTGLAELIINTPAILLVFNYLIIKKVVSALFCKYFIGHIR